MPDRPALLGYPVDETIQLVSGSHRWAAAQAVGISVPVSIKSYAEVHDIWCTRAWIEWLTNPPQAKEARAIEVHAP